MEFRPQIIRYLHDCYREDNARSTLWNLLGSGVEHQIFIEGKEELLDGFLEESPLPHARAEPAREAAAVYQKEKQLLYAAFPIIGKMSLPDGKQRPVFSPLLTFPASIATDGEYSALRIELEGRRTNAGLLDSLQSEQGETPLADLIDGALDDWNICEAEVSALAKILTDNISGLDASSMWEFPRLADAKSLRSAAQATELGSGFRVFPAAMVCLVKRPTESRGVLTELEEIATGETPSPPVRFLVSGAELPPAEDDTSPDAIPAVLSASQTKILQRARTDPVSLVIGPPGTGKSYTIAAIALDHFNRGESVLIGSKMNHAVDVIANKIEAQLGSSGKVVRAGRRHYLRELKAYIDNLLHGPPGVVGEIKESLASLDKTRTRTEKRLAELERFVARSNGRHLKWGATLAGLAGGSRSIPKRLAGAWIRWRHRSAQPLWDAIGKIHTLLGQRTSLIAEQVKQQHEMRLAVGLRAHRSDIVTFRSALGARTGTRQDELFEKIRLETFLRLLPIWLVNLSDAHRVLPHRPELFDVAIIDEATQCDIASCLPLLQRAKRAVIVGDPKQLRHLSFLARARQKEFADNHGLDEVEARLFDYRDHSILDLTSRRIESQGSVNFLNEHFRSEPPIIRFSNEQFYAGKLNVMTEKPGVPSGDALSLHQLGGRRDEMGINKLEADAVIAALGTELQSARGEPGGDELSIGILSPFRAQVDHLAERIGHSVPTEAIHRHKLLIGTAHTFQGEERHIMLISLAIDADSPAASRRFLERPDVFNVAITRARLRQKIFSSIDPGQLPTGSLLRQYLGSIAAATDPVTHGADQFAQLDRFANEVKRELESRGCQVWLGYPVAGLRIDLLALKDGQNLAVDLIGCPGPTAHVFPLERYKMFARAGLTLWATALYRLDLRPPAVPRSDRESARSSRVTNSLAGAAVNRGW